MGRYEDQLPAIVMVLLQCVYAIMALLNRAALVKGMSPRVFMFYRQAIATLVMSPVAFFARGKSTSCSMGFRTFLLIFVTAFVGLEQVHVKKLSSLAKMLGTAFCVIGAGCMALLRGPKLLNVQLPPAANSVVLKSFGGDDTWLLGCLFIFASMCCWSFWLILQVPLTACYPNHLSLSAWMCFLSMLQSGAIALLLERDPAAWNLSSNLELTCCFFSGIFGSGVQFFAQAWCISRRGPLYSAMFNPLCTVITTVMACIFLHEELYVGSILGAAAVIIGLYTVLLGKAREMKEKLLESEDFVSNPSKAAQEKASFKIDDLEQPLLADICNDQV
ncbi:WAT1-related protein At4g30420 isoform X2 [Beta vulgaris subsp. vulgaris]|uniref:WAT1-related protein At4g30420 isoform X2 n=1 Tax=Beta vulgaris subsp. vulgaris TaxID=3555 RepID=UPI002546D46D|nr:WAT1-related protein At4g30420 isoform X2 [Beta vulgaris subsp. vulgaris]